jgi:hypothetical protein
MGVVHSRKLEVREDAVVTNSGYHGAEARGIGYVR